MVNIIEVEVNPEVGANMPEGVVELPPEPNDEHVEDSFAEQMMRINVEIEVIESVAPTRQSNDGDASEASAFPELDSAALENGNEATLEYLADRLRAHQEYMAEQPPVVAQHFVEHIDEEGNLVLMAMDPMSNPRQPRRKRRGCLSERRPQDAADRNEDYDFFMHMEVPINPVQNLDEHVEEYMRMEPPPPLAQPCQNGHIGDHLNDQLLFDFYQIPDEPWYIPPVLTFDHATQTRYNIGYMDTWPSSSALVPITSTWTFSYFALLLVAVFAWLSVDTFACFCRRW